MKLKNIYRYKEEKKRDITRKDEIEDKSEKQN